MALTVALISLLLVILYVLEVKAILWIDERDREEEEQDKD